MRKGEKTERLRKRERRGELEMRIEGVFLIKPHHKGIARVKVCRWIPE